MRHIDTLVIHHSASKEGSVPMFTAEHAARGFGTIGYHYVVGNNHGIPDGQLEAGRPESQKGCGVYGANTGKLHICLVGNFHSGDPEYTGLPSRAQLKTLGEWLVKKGAEYDVDSARVVGHKEITVPGHATACPGNQFPLAPIRNWYHVAAILHKSGQPIPPLSEWLTDHGYFDKGRPALTPLTTKVVTPTRVFIDEKEIKEFLLYQNHVYLRPAALALVMNWPQADWDPTTRTLTIWTKTK